MSWRRSRWPIAWLVVVAVFATVSYLYGADSDEERSTVVAASKPTLDSARRSSDVPRAVGGRSTADNKLSRTSAAPLIVESFESQQDIWAYASEATLSDNSGQVFEAHRAARECIGVVKMLDELGTFAAGGSGSLMKGALTPERQLAIQGLTQRCGGFLRHSFSERRNLVDSLERRGQALQGSEFLAHRSSQSDLSRMRDLLFSPSPAAKESALPMLLLHLEPAGSTGDPTDRRSAVAGVAALLALCDLGKDCSGASFSTQLQCALSGKCGSSLWEGWEADFSADEIEVLRSTRQRIVAAIVKRNLALLGQDDHPK